MNSYWVFGREMESSIRRSEKGIWLSEIPQYAVPHHFSEPTPTHTHAQIFQLTALLFVCFRVKFLGEKQKG